MFEEQDEDDAQHHECSSLEGLRDHILMVFGGFIAKLNDESPTNMLEYQRQFLELWEVENIVKEQCDVSEDGMYGIGANSFDEYKEKMLSLFRALGSRVLSNVMAAGVKEGFLDADYDFEKDAFAFSVTEKGMQLVYGQSDNDSAAGTP